MKYPEGVELRGKSIRIWFMFRGKRCRETLKGWDATSANIKKAGRLRAVIVSEISEGKFDYLARFPNSQKALELGGKESISHTTTVGTLIDKWLLIKEPDLTSNTMRKTRSLCRTCTDILGRDRVIASITLEDALTLRSELLNGTTRYSSRANKAGRTARTVNNYLATYSEAWSFAVRSGYIKDNPFHHVPHVASERKEPDPLEHEEFERLVLHPSLREQERNLWTVAVYTGLRHGELCALAWEDIDLVRGELHVSRNLTSQGDFKCPKTKSGERTVMLLAPALNALKQQREITALRQPEDVKVALREPGRHRVDQCRWVFATGLTKFRNNTKNKHYCTSGISQLWDSCVKRAGIRRRNPYHTRHTYACWMLTADANPNWIAQQMGHKDATMVLTVYGKFMPSKSLNEVEKLNQKFEECPTGAPLSITGNK